MLGVLSHDPWLESMWAVIDGYVTLTSEELKNLRDVLNEIEL